jgi:hypothetical protein
MPNAEITIGQIYWFQPDNLARVLFSSKEGDMPMDNGLFPKIYSFGYVGDRTISVHHVQGNDFSVEPGRKISFANREPGTSFYHSSERGFQDLRRKIEISLVTPSVEKHVRRNITSLDSVEEFELLVKDRDALSIYHGGRKKIALFSGFHDGIVWLTFRDSEGRVRTIKEAAFNPSKIKIDENTKGLLVYGAELNDVGREHTWNVDEDSTRSYDAMDQLLSSQGIVRNPV